MVVKPQIFHFLVGMVLKHFESFELFIIIIIIS